MSKGFKKEISQTKESNNYKTIFEKIKDLAGNEEKPLRWYRNETKKIAFSYKKDPRKFIRDERIDRNDNAENQDKNTIRRYAKQGRLFLFEYEAKMRYLQYYDKFPLVYVIKANKDHFIGANLHYLHPNKRILTINKLKEGRIDVPSICINKYITDHIDGFLLDLASAEWDTAIALPVENFVKPVGDKELPYKSNDVWKETNKNYSQRFKAKRIVKGYGKLSDIEDVI
jgi:hypothetical protein